MGTVFFLLLGALLVHGVRLSQEEEHHLEPVSFVQDTPAADESRIICTHECYPSVDCLYTAWGAWSPCAGISSCGGPYFVNRTRGVAQNPMGNGTSCKEQAMFDSRPCNQTELDQLLNSPGYQSSCAVPCIQGPWYVKQECDVGPASCPTLRAQAPVDGIVVGQIIKARDVTQEPKFGGAPCGPNLDVVPCSYNCKYDCEWSDWMNNGCELPCIPPADGAVTNGQKKFRTIKYFPVNGGAACVGDTTKVEGPCENTANFPICCPGCTEGPWGDWTGCTLTCGSGGSQKRTRVVTPPSAWYSNPQICAGSMAVCGATEQTQECCKEPCPVDCQCGDWSDWSECFSEESIFFSCGAGTKTRTRNCSPAQWGGKACPETVQTVDCFLPGCPVPCEVSTWSDFSPCPASCGVRVMRTRTREVLVEPSNGGAPCPPLDDTRACPCIDCPVDCQLGPWGEWGACSTPCGPGTQIRTRDVLVAPRNGGLGCLPEQTIETKDCEVNEQGWYQWGPTPLPANKPCDVNCQVGAWSEWSSCSKTCTSDTDSTFPGIKTRTREIKVQAQYEGNRCPGTVEQQWCNTQCCPVDMVLSDWTDWSDCSVSCGGGHQYRRRIISTYPRCGGHVIDEPLEDSRVCNSQCCQQTCVYYSYATWSPCLLATTSQLTAITSDPSKDDATKIAELSEFPSLKDSCPAVAGAHWRNRGVRIANPCGTCPETWEVGPCYQSCPIECEMYAWGNWSPCTAECGYGSQRRTRAVKVEGKNGGSPCPCTEEYRPCFQGPCCEECTLSPWNDWEPCSATCGGGSQNRRRFVNMSTQACPEYECAKEGLLQTQSCNNFPCPQKCIMNEWSGWGPCSAECGPGYQSRTRTPASFGEGGCPWDWEEQVCNQGDCPIPCTYTEWTDWTPCGATCVPASAPATIAYYQYRARYRISGPQDDSCPPTEPQQIPCTPPPCDVLCQVGEWGNWTECSSPWGWGQQERYRSVTVTPTGDNLCPQLYEIHRCYHPPPANNCTFSEWSDWSECSATCRGSSSPPPIMMRQRVLITSPETTDHTSAEGDIGSSVTMSEEACKDYGDLSETQQCVDVPFCPVDCVMTRWSAWSKCTPPGVRHRTRRVFSLPNFGGAACPICTTETDRCTVQSNEGLPQGQCEVGPCLQEVEAELAAKQNGGNHGEAQVAFAT